MTRLPSLQRARSPAHIAGSALEATHASGTLGFAAMTTGTRA